MKLNFESSEVEKSGKFQNQAFGLGDSRVIMELFSSKIYARPKYIIVQEIASNARDANREAGRADWPIKIQLPNKLVPKLIIADNGPGITPSRMSDVYLNYGNSTKRADNVLTGGFGIGAKTPFTYTDSFTVTTVSDEEDGVRRRRVYVAQKTDTGSAEMNLMSTTETDEETGTAISFVVDPNDFDDFTQATRKICQFWEPLPEVTGVSSFKFPTYGVKPIHTGTGWELYPRVDTYTNRNARNGSFLLVDDIPYDLRINEIFDYYSDGHRLLTQLNAVFRFKTGEIQVSATREDIDYGDETIKLIRDRVQSIIDELQSTVDASIQGASTLLEASQQWHSNKHDYAQFVEQPKFKGQELMPSSFFMPRSYYKADKLSWWPSSNTSDGIVPSDEVKIRVYVEDNGSVQMYKRYGNQGVNSFKINEIDNHAFVIDDEGKSRPNRLRLLKLFEDDANLKRVVVFTLNNPIGLDFLKNEMHLDEFDCKLLSKLPKSTSKKANQKGSKRSVNAVKKFNLYDRKFYPEKSRSPEDTDGGVYVILKYGKPIDANGNEIDIYRLRRIADSMDGNDEPLYGILYKYRNKIDDSWTELSDHLAAEYLTLASSPAISHIKEWGAGPNSYDMDFNRVIEFVKNGKLKLKDKRFKEYVDTKTLSDKYFSDFNRFNLLADVIGQPRVAAGSKLTKLIKEIGKDYPLINYFDLALAENWSKKAKPEEVEFHLNVKFDTL